MTPNPNAHETPESQRSAPLAGSRAKNRVRPPTDKQMDLLANNEADWAMVSEHGSLVEVFTTEEKALAKLKQIDRISPGHKWRVQCITWSPSSNEMVAAKRAAEAWISAE
jgi:hypothetical protein